MDEPAAAANPRVRTAIEQLHKLAAADISATSPGKRATVRHTEGRFEVRLRPEGFQQLDPEILAREVAHAFAGAMRGCEAAERQLMGDFRPAERPDPPGPVRERRRELMRRERSGIAVTAESPNRMASGTWRGDTGLRLRITAANESHREQLAGELSIVVNRLTELYRTELKRIMRETKRQVPAEVRT